MAIHIPHSEGKTAFRCPHCKVHAKFTNYQLHYRLYSQTQLHNFTTKQCSYCDQFSIWNKSNMIYPQEIEVADANIDLTPEIISLYNEAASILGLSPKGACALLRLALQLLCKELGELGNNINDDIAMLVSKGLNPTIQKSLDLIRVVGNSAVHPGEIKLDDNKEIAIQMFSLLNLIAETMITIPKKVSQTYDSILPEKAKNAIIKRDDK